MAIEILKFTSFAIAFLLYPIPQDANSRNQSLGRHSEIIQDRSLPPTFEICEFSFDVNNEKHDFQGHIIATKRIFWLCTKIFSNIRYSFKIVNLCVHYIMFIACNKIRNKLQFYILKTE